MTAPMEWHALPPEVNTARLMAGAGPAPMLAAAMGWEALAAALEAQSAALAVRLNALGEAWTGGSSDKAISAAKPMITWLQTAAQQAQMRAERATAQAGAYTTALAATPSLIEIATNHITTAVLMATNFFGINTMPIGFNEMDYFVRMWTQAAVAMDVYEAETIANTLFQKLESMTAILDPAVSDTLSSGMGQLSGMTSNLTSTLSAAVPSAETLQATAGQVAELAGPMQQLTQPVSQVSSLFGQMGSMGGSGGGQLGGAGHDGAQIGLLGASPLSNHPLAGGTGPSAGSGLLRGESLPGAGGSLARTPLMAELLESRVGPSMTPAAAAAGAGAGSSATGGTAPLGAGAMGQGAQAGGASRAGLVAPAPLRQEHDENDLADWGDDQEDW
jgi:PPE-repeat protein